MSVKKEGGNKEMSGLIVSERDFDIHTLSGISSAIENLSGTYFILTGSYAIEALTGSSLSHNDLDANVFTKNLERVVPSVVELFDKQSEMVLHKKTNDRLEYDVISGANFDSPRRLELQFVELVNVSEDQTLEFTLKSEGENSFNKVPTIVVPLIDSKGKEEFFRVKSLPYAVATWVIRISNLAQSPKRQVRDSDLEHLRMLLAGEYDLSDVLSIMRSHPQMPRDVAGDWIFEQALRLLSNK